MSAINIDSEKCIVCGACTIVCPQGALNIYENRVFVDNILCSGCGDCVEICPTEAIRTILPVELKQRKGVTNMFRKHGYGFRGNNLPWPYVGRGRGGLPRCWWPEAFDYGPRSRWEGNYYPPPMSKEGELDILKSKAESIKDQLEEIKSRIKELETKE